MSGTSGTENGPSAHTSSTTDIFLSRLSQKRLGHWDRENPAKTTRSQLSHQSRPQKSVHRTGGKGRAWVLFG